MAVLFGAGFLLAGVVPPPSPRETAQEIAQFYTSDVTALRIGLIMTVAAASLLGPYFAVLCVQMRRMEGVRPAFAYTQLALGALTIIEFIFPVMIMLTATFRADRDPELLMAMNDLAWIMFLGIVSTFVVQLIVIGFAILCDRRTAPVFPRWVGYLNLWMALLFTPATVLIFFKSGPFAWDGLLVWWLPFAAFVLWFPVNTFFLLKAVREDDYAAIDDDRHHELRRDIDQLITEIALLRTVVSGGTASSSG